MGEMLLPALASLGYPLPVPIAHVGRITKECRYPVIGTNLFVPALPAGHSAL